MSETKKCLLCDNEPHVRGLCKRCYGSARQKVTSGLTTWDQLVEMGLVLPAQNKPVNPFTAALNKAFTEKSNG